MKQTTLAAPVETKGIGLAHGRSGQGSALMPAPPDTGYVFRRTDLGGFEIPGDRRIGGSLQLCDHVDAHRA